MYDRSFEVTGAVDGYLPTDKIVEFREFGSGEVYTARVLFSCPEWGRLKEWIDAPAKARFLARSARPDLADPQYWLADLESTNPPYKRVDDATTVAPGTCSSGRTAYARSARPPCSTPGGSGR